MKTPYKSIFLLLLVLTGLKARAQYNIDISTGVYANGAVMPVGTVDPRWEESENLTGPYQAVTCGTGQQGTSPWVGNGQFHPTGAGPMTHAMFVSAQMDGAGLNLPFPQPSDFLFYYRRKVNVYSCAIQSAKLHFNRIGADIKIMGVYVNSTFYPYPGPDFSAGFQNNVTIPVTISQGANDIIVEVQNGGCGHVGLEIDGFLEISTCAWAGFDLQTESGTSTTEFCMTEDVFLNGVGNFPNNAHINLYRDMGSGLTLFNSVSAMGHQNGFNAESLFPVLQNPNPSWSFKLTLSLPNNACELDISDVFHFVCCDGSASFNLSNNGSALVGSSTINGFNKWTVYTFPPGNGGSYTQIGTFDGNAFVIDAQNACYYVTLETQSACGNQCLSQSVCNLDCDVEPCILTQPKNVKRAPKGFGNVPLSWDPVIGADHYLLELTFNDPECCSGDFVFTGGPNQYSYTSTDTNYGLVPPPKPEMPELPPGFPPVDFKRCYAIRVYAVCKDGSRSEASDVICVQEQ